MLTALFGVLLSAACGDRIGRGSDPGYARLVGSWKPVSMIFESKAEPSVRVDLIALGYRDPLVLSGRGTFDEGPFGRGRAGIEEGRLALDYGSGHKELYTFSRRGNTLLLGNQDDDRFDFDGDGKDEPASMTAVMVRHR